ncbi:MAG: hypothetical protein WC462_04845 [archaeon]
MKKLIFVVVVILIVLFLVVGFLFLPFGNTSGGRVVFEECNNHIEYFLYKNLSNYNDNILLSQKFNSEGELIIDSMIWINCVQKPKIFSYKVDGKEIKIQNGYYSNWAGVILSSRTMATCICPHRVTYYISGLSESEYSVSVEKNNLIILSEEDSAKLLELLEK